MKLFIAILLIFGSSQVFAEDVKDLYNQSRAIALVDAKLLGERDQLGLSMERYRIVSDADSTNHNYITVGVAGPGGECTVIVHFDKQNGQIQITNLKCPVGS